MLHADQSLRQTKRTWILLALMALIHASQLMPLAAIERSAGNSWTAMNFIATTPHVQLMYRAEKQFNPDQPTFVITHGMGGLETGDRFHFLADAVSEVAPESNVLIVNWSEHAWKTGYLGIPDPWAVAKKIEPVAQEASELFHELGLESGNHNIYRRKLRDLRECPNCGTPWRTRHDAGLQSAEPVSRIPHSQSLRLL
jgi:hypothetical protein